MRAAHLCIVTAVCLSLGVSATVLRAEQIPINIPANASPRVQYGAQRLRNALKDAGIDRDSGNFGSGIEIRVVPGAGAAEGYSLGLGGDGARWINGNDDSGALYGCLELARRVRETKQLPAVVDFSDAPALKLRGPCIGMQKTYILPGRHVYEYPYTPELFPFFYDKAFWTEYLDFLAENRMNTLYLWSGHPFASLVRLKDYPYAVEVPDDVFEKNVEMYRWISAECDRRGIWLVQMFYNIILSKPFAEKNNLSTQLADSTPLVDDYMRKSIAEFVKQYPHVGLLVCLGEALKGTPNQVHFLNEVIIPGMHDGMKQAGLSEEPPIVIRRHTADLDAIMPGALKLYKNLYTECKYTGESLTTSEPRGKWQQIFQNLSQLGSTSLANIHILSNLEPFRYGDQRFIQQCVQASRDRLGVKGIHLYPLCYWNWPDSADKTADGQPLKQLDRDWIWFEAWARYSWNPDIDPATDHAYWISRLTEKYGSKEAAEKILSAYNDSGECAPRIIRRFGITEGNRQTMSLGMTLDQLWRPERYSELPDLWESDAPPGERIKVYVDREWKKQSHEGETPLSINEEILDFSAKAVAAIDAAEPLVTQNSDEYQRLRNDVHCIRAMSQFYAAKVNAAMLVLRFNNYSHDVADMEKAQVFLAESLDHYRKLTELTKDTYNFVNSMQTSQRKIPVVGGAGGKPANYHWTQVLPVYEKEVADFNKQVEALKNGAGKGEVTAESTIKPLAGASFKLNGNQAQTYEVKVGANPFTDRKYRITAVAPELAGLTGIRFSHEEAKSGRYAPVEIETDQPVQVLLGYFQDKRELFLQPPSLETDAQAADRSDIDPVILNAATIEESPAVNVHVFKLDKGRHTIDVRGKGSFVILGVIPQSTQLNKRDAHSGAGGS